jgi:hypothetical protein
MAKFAFFNIPPSLNPGRIFTGSGRPSSRYAFAALMVIFTLVIIGLGQVVFGSVPLMLFAVAIVTASKFAGIGGGIFSVVLSTLACDFFFLPPIFAIDFDQTTWSLAAKYGAVAVVSYLIFRQKQLGVASMEQPALAGYGHLDGVREGEIFGWAMDLEHPDEAAKITVHMDDRPVAEALAVYYRPDVAEQFQCSGRNGFFFDLSQICEVDTDAIVDVRLSNGKLIEGAPVAAHVPHRTHPGGPRCFSCTSRKQLARHSGRRWSEITSEAKLRTSTPIRLGSRYGIYEICRSRSGLNFALLPGTFSTVSTTTSPTIAGTSRSCGIPLHASGRTISF